MSQIILCEKWSAWEPSSPWTRHGTTPSRSVGVRCLIRIQWTAGYVARRTLILTCVRTYQAGTRHHIAACRPVARPADWAPASAACHRLSLGPASSIRTAAAATSLQDGGRRDVYPLAPVYRIDESVDESGWTGLTPLVYPTTTAGVCCCGSSFTGVEQPTGLAASSSSTRTRRSRRHLPESGRRSCEDRVLLSEWPINYDYQDYCWTDFRLNDVARRITTGSGRLRTRPVLVD